MSAACELTHILRIETQFKEELVQLNKRVRDLESFHQEREKKYKVDLETSQKECVDLKGKVSSLEKQLEYAQSRLDQNNQNGQDLQSTIYKLQSVEAQLKTQTKSHTEQLQGVRKQLQDEMALRIENAMNNLEKIHTEMCGQLDNAFKELKVPPLQQNKIKECIIPYLDKMRTALVL